MNDKTTLPFSAHLSSDVRARIKDLEQQNPGTDELWALLGKSVEGEAATGEEPDGKGVFNRQLLRIKQAVCDNKEVMDFLDSPQGGDTTNLVIVITGALTAAKFFGIDVVAVAFLIARMGVRKMCASQRID